MGLLNVIGCFKRELRHVGSMKVASVVGARPQFIKAAIVSRLLREEYEELLIHTDQHYDENLSKVFFDVLDIPKPDSVS